MYQAEFRFYGILNDFLSPEHRSRSFFYPFLHRNSVKDAIESLGVPHPEIEFILVNGEPQSFAHIIDPDDRIGVYPHFFDLDIPPELRVTPPLPPEIRFVLDVHLGKLASYLRMLGYDTLYRNDYEDPTLATISAEEQRILLTRDIGLLKRSQVVFGYFIRATNPLLQIQEVCLRFSLLDKIHPLTRCMQCNAVLQGVSKEQVWEQIPEKVKQSHTTFFLCPSCQKVYWSGTHCDKMETLIDILKSKNGFPPDDFYREEI